MSYFVPGTVVGTRHRAFVPGILNQPEPVMFGFHLFASFLLLFLNESKFGGLWHLLHTPCDLGSVQCLQCMISPSGKLPNGDKSLDCINEFTAEYRPHYLSSGIHKMILSLTPGD